MPDLKAPMRYHGGKQRIADWVAARLPDNPMYTEPFFGMGSVLLARPASKRELANDIDRNLYAFWTTIRDHPDRMQGRLDRTPLRSRDIHADARRELENPDLPLEDRAYWWVLLAWMSYSGIALQRRNHYATCHNPDVGAPKQWPVVQPLADRMRSVEIERRDGVEVLQRFAHHASQTVYVDPPYPTASTLNDYAALPDYGLLAEALLAQKGACAVSGHPGDWPQLDQAGWNRQTVPVATTMPNDVRQPGDPTKNRIEVLWTNYTPPAQAQFDV